MGFFLLKKTEKGAPQYFGVFSLKIYAIKVFEGFPKPYLLNVEGKVMQK
jgi:hypothetical protein